MSAFRRDGIVLNAVGEAIAGAQIYLCTQPANTSAIPPSPLATLFTDSTGTTQATNPVTSDGNGNYFLYTAAGTYTVVIFDPFGRIPTQIFPDQQVLSPGSGTVTSIALAVPGELTVSGSPITISGTFIIGKSNVNANLVAAGPSSGFAAPWTFRSLVAADLPASVGSVSSVTLTLTGSSLLILGVTGSPIVSNGTLALTVNFANQLANTGLFGPTAGGSGPVTARLMVPADQPGLAAVSFSATPVFNAGISNSFSITLTGNVASSTVTNATAGQRITFIITQDATGGRAWVWPPNFKDPSAIAPDANSVSVQDFIYDGANWRPTGPGATMGSWVKK